MSDPHPLMMLLLTQASFVGPAEQIEDNIQPIQAQLDFGPGDFAILAMANTPLERDFVIAKGVDPVKYADQYPDWEERMAGLAGSGWGSHVLCQLFSRSDPELTIGWVSRLKIFPISSYRYREARKWLREGFPEHSPPWIEQTYLKWTDELAKAAPEVVPQVVQCPACQGRHVVIEVIRQLGYTAKAGMIKVDGKDHYIPVTNVDQTDEHSARLRCEDCDQIGDLTDDEWSLPDITN